MIRCVLLAWLLVLPSFAQEPAPPVLGILLQQLAKTEDTGTQLNLLRGINAALKGRRGITPPPEWTALSGKLGKSENAEIREIVQTLGGVFGSSSAFAEMRKTIADPKAELAARRKALESLIAAKDAEAPALLRQLLVAPGELRTGAIRGLAAFNEEDTVALLMKVYPELTPEQKRDALSTIAARPRWAAEFPALLESGRIKPADVSVTLVRQLRGFQDKPLDAALDRHFGKMSGGSAERQAEIAKIKEWLTAESVKSGNSSNGRAVFARTCAICHKLFDAGMEIGPELTGANRTDIDYLLQNIVDPNALIGIDYQVTTIETKDGRVLAGMVRAEDANTLTLRTLTEQVVIPVADVKLRLVSPMSMMPEGQLTALPKEDARDLFRYLASPQQVPLPASP